MRLSKIFPEPIVGQIYALFHSKENDKIWLEKIKTAKIERYAQKTQRSFQSCD